MKIKKLLLSILLAFGLGLITLKPNLDAKDLTQWELFYENDELGFPTGMTVFQENGKVVFEIPSLLQAMKRNDIQYDSIRFELNFATYQSGQAPLLVKNFIGNAWIPEENENSFTSLASHELSATNLDLNLDLEKDLINQEFNTKIRIEPGIDSSEGLDQDIKASLRIYLRKTVSDSTWRLVWDAGNVPYDEVGEICTDTIPGVIFNNLTEKMIVQGKQFNSIRFEYNFPEVQPGNHVFDTDVWNDQVNPVHFYEDSYSHMTWLKEFTITRVSENKVFYDFELNLNDPAIIGFNSYFTLRLAYSDVPFDQANFDANFKVHMRIAPYDEKPVIDGTRYFISNFDRPIPVSEIKNQLRAYDAVDGDITNRIVIDSNDYYVDGGVDNRKVLGEHPIVFSVTDNAGNKTTLTVLVAVRDLTFPVISGLDTIDARTDVRLTDEQILANYTATDNVTGDISNRIIILSSEYTESSFGKIGRYSVTLEAKDLQNNATTKVITINVQDKIAPIINGSSTITKSTSEVLTLSDILKKYSASDNIDGALPITVLSDTYSGNGKVPGTYEIILKAVDAAGNITTFKIALSVVDSDKPWFIVNENFLNTSVYNSLTTEQIIEILRKIGRVSELMQTYTILENTYLGMESIPGTYSFRAKFKGNTGIEQDAALYVVVYEPEEQTELPQLSGWDKFMESIKEWWDWNFEKSGVIPNWTFSATALVGVSAFIGALVIKHNRNKKEQVKKVTANKNKDKKKKRQ